MQSTIEQLDVILSNETKNTEKSDLIINNKFDSKSIKNENNNNSKLLNVNESNNKEQSLTNDIIHTFDSLKQNSSTSLSSIKNASSNKYVTKTLNKPMDQQCQISKSHLTSAAISKPQSENYSIPIETVNKLTEKVDLDCRIVRAHSLRDITSKFEKKSTNEIVNNNANNLQQQQKQPIDSFNFSKKINANDTIKETNKRFSLLEMSSSNLTSDYLDSVDYTKLHHHQPNSSSAIPSINKEYIIELHRKLNGLFFSINF